MLSLFSVPDHGGWLQVVQLNVLRSKDYIPPLEAVVCYSSAVNKVRHIQKAEGQNISWIANHCIHNT